MNETVVVPSEPNPETTVQHYKPDENEYETLVFATQNAFVEHFQKSALAAQEFMTKLTQNRSLSNKEKKHFARDLKEIAKEEYKKQEKDEKGNVVLKLPKMKRVAALEEEPKDDIKATDGLSVYLFTRNQTAHFRGEVCNGELFPDFVNDYLNDMRWVKEIADMDKNRLLCLFCQEEMDERPERKLVMKKVSARMEAELVEAKCWLSCPHCELSIPTWEGEEEHYKNRGVSDLENTKDWKFVPWGKRKIDVVIPTQTIYFANPPSLEKP